MINIAIAEDCKEHQDLLKTYIEQNSKFNLVHIANNGVEMLQYCSAAKQLPDVAIVDYQMNPMDGLQLTSYCSFFFPSIKVLALSSHDHLYAIENMFACGAKGYKNNFFLSRVTRQGSYFNMHLNSFYNSIETIANNEFYLDEMFSWRDNPIFSFTNYNPSSLFQKRSEEIKNCTIKNCITKQEFKILHLFCSGFSNKEIAGVLFVETKTIDNHLENIYKKLNAHSSKDVVSQAYRYGLVPCAKLEYAT